MHFHLQARSSKFRRRVLKRDFFVKEYEYLFWAGITAYGRSFIRLSSPFLPSLWISSRILDINDLSQGIKMPKLA